MNRPFTRAAGVLAACGSLIAPLACARPAQQLVASAIELPGVEGRIDHLALDRERGHLWIAALENGSVEVVDVAAGKHLRSIRGLGEPQGVALLPRAGRVAVSDGKRGTLVAFDAESLEKVASVEVGDDADNVRYDARHERVLVGYGSGGLALVDAPTWSVSARVPLDAHPESFQIDAAGERAWVNVPGARAVVACSLVPGKTVRRFDLSSARRNYPMALSADGRELLVGCREPPKLLVLDPESGKVVAEVALSGDVDDIFIDEERGRAYAACGEGFLDVFEHDSGGWKAHERIPTAAGARTCLFVPEEGRIYLAVPHRGAQRAEVRVLALGS